MSQETIKFDWSLRFSEQPCSLTLEFRSKHVNLDLKATDFCYVTLCVCGQILENQTDQNGSLREILWIQTKSKPVQKRF